MGTRILIERLVPILISNYYILDKNIANILKWKFDIIAHKKILIDIGHVCQNLYLASEFIESGTCAIGIYNQEMIDKLLWLDGDKEFVLYLALVGKKRD